MLIDFLLAKRKKKTFIQKNIREQLTKFKYHLFFAEAIIKLFKG